MFSAFTTYHTIRMRLTVPQKHSGSSASTMHSISSSLREGASFQNTLPYEQRENVREIYRKSQGVGKRNLPEPVVKLFSSNLAFVDTGTFGKATKSWCWQMILSVMSDTISEVGG